MWSLPSLLRAFSTTPRAESAAVERSPQSSSRSRWSRSQRAVDAAAPETVAAQPRIAPTRPASRRQGQPSRVNTPELPAAEHRRARRRRRRKTPAAKLAQAEADPLVSNGLGSPLCKGVLGAGELPSSGSATARPRASSQRLRRPATTGSTCTSTRACSGATRESVVRTYRDAAVDGDRVVGARGRGDARVVLHDRCARQHRGRSGRRPAPSAGNVDAAVAGDRSLSRRPCWPCTTAWSAAAWPRRSARRW